jgi:DNA-binding CsgD family transcriptional regulator
VLNAEVNAEVNAECLANFSIPFKHSPFTLYFSIQHSAFIIAMRVVIVGPPAARARLSGTLPDGLEIVGEARTMAEARRLILAADAWLVATTDRDDADAEGHESLSAREIEVLELLAQGLPNKSIAVRLGISDQTVKFHVASICGKLGAANRTDAARRALRRGVIPL